MSHGDSHDTRQGLHDELHQEIPPSRQPVDLDSDEEMQAPKTRDTRNPNLGANPIIMDLYEGNFPGGAQWTTNKPSLQTSNDQERAAIKVFRVLDQEKSVFKVVYPWKIYRIDVQNPLLVSALAPILKKENVHLDPRRVATFKDPFHALWFLHGEIVDRFSTNGDPLLKPFLKQFVEVLDELFQGLNAKKAKLLKSKLMDFKTAWTLFPRDSSVYTSSEGFDILRKVDSAKYERGSGYHQLLITCKTISFSGEGFYWSKKYLAIPEFAGKKPIRELGCYPVEFCKDQDSITERLTGRGRKVLDLQGLTYHTYNGIAIVETGPGPVKQNVNSRIVIDVWGYHIYQGHRVKDDPEKEWMRDRPEGDNSNGLRQRLSAEDQANNKNEMLQRPNELVFMNETISGFSLKGKLWLQFYVEDIQPITWNSQAYSQLVYNEPKKELVLSLVQNHNMNNGTSTAMQDVIVGKGQGLIVLLSGPPGTGKTLMAEAIAEHLRRPLYHLQADDLGTQVAPLSSNFFLASKTAAAWDAIILLDGADAFIAARGPRDVRRNELASAFLYELEYFSGIIFLTTNLPTGAIDGAFCSRANIHLVFHPLFMPKKREKVWRMHLRRVPKQRDIRSNSEGGEEVAPDEPNAMPLNDEEITQLGLWDLDGRQIKSAIQTVHSWCQNKG
ncbi:hypothetical protein CEP53_013374 [Fusarium sp. AF-6]|nr:hypothetical protein CEP53_013374 [Fusarium sp. AF-6]